MVRGLQVGQSNLHAHEAAENDAEQTRSEPEVPHDEGGTRARVRTGENGREENGC